MNFNPTKDVKPMLTEKQILSLKEELLQQKKQLQTHLHNDKPSLEVRSERENTGELSLYDNHPGDMGTELYEREKDFALDEHAEDELEKVNQALKAIEDGTYGICKATGKEIPYERLQAVPTTLYTKEHNPEQAIFGDRPVEEEVLEPAHGNHFQHMYNVDGIRDSQDSFQEVGRYGTSETPSDLQGDYEDYDSLYRDRDEDMEGFAEEYESFVGTDIEGKDVKVYPSKEHEEYEERLDNENLESPIGNIPYKRDEGYVTDDDD
jgi:YteA family regulatory protein